MEIYLFVLQCHVRYSAIKPITNHQNKPRLKKPKNPNPPNHPIPQSPFDLSVPPQMEIYLFVLQCHVRYSAIKPITNHQNKPRLKKPKNPNPPNHPIPQSPFDLSVPPQMEIYLFALQCHARYSAIKPITNHQSPITNHQNKTKTEKNPKNPNPPNHPIPPITPWFVGLPVNGDLFFCIAMPCQIFSAQKTITNHQNKTKT